MCRREIRKAPARQRTVSYVEATRRHRDTYYLDRKRLISDIVHTIHSSPSHQGTKSRNITTAPTADEDVLRYSNVNPVGRAVSNEISCRWNYLSSWIRRSMGA